MLKKGIKITSDGIFTRSVKVIDLETNKEIPNIVSISIDMYPEDVIKSRLEILVNEVDITTKDKFSKIDSYENT